MPRRMRNMVPPHVWALVAPYGIAPSDGEANSDTS
jgi:coenzyme F420 hydrogenase subunit beta